MEVRARVSRACACRVGIFFSAWQKSSNAQLLVVTFSLTIDKCKRYKCSFVIANCVDLRRLKKIGKHFETCYGKPNARPYDRVLLLPTPRRSHEKLFRVDLAYSTYRVARNALLLYEYRNVAEKKKPNDLSFLIYAHSIQLLL